jgi:hypothetical protein
MKFNSTSQSFRLVLIFSIIIKLIYSFYIPINIIPSSPHDDYLFYRLAESISEFKWLGGYLNTTLIKGPIYPLFISISIFTHIPLRLIESVLIISVAFYVITYIRYFIKSIHTITVMSILEFLEI